VSVDKEEFFYILEVIRFRIWIEEFLFFEGFFSIAISTLFHNLVHISTLKTDWIFIP